MEHFKRNFKISSTTVLVQYLRSTKQLILNDYSLIQYLIRVYKIFSKIVGTISLEVTGLIYVRTRMIYEYDYAFISETESVDS